MLSVVDNSEFIKECDVCFPLPGNSNTLENDLIGVFLFKKMRLFFFFVDLLFLFGFLFRSSPLQFIFFN
ncbi:MAG: hypothetical protein RBG13Loki_2239 [Promethearchaeota archaeon CR_4]|nr:MAG: hypothetical protein RBG13Loki_2239 [Candidatus Lokiarchaeota archaeon CR_4]